MSDDEKRATAIWQIVADNLPRDALAPDCIEGLLIALSELVVLHAYDPKASANTIAESFPTYVERMLDTYNLLEESRRASQH